MTDHSHQAPTGALGTATATGAQRAGPQFRPQDAVDFVVVGSGTAGGIVAKELSERGFRVVVLEQGPWRRENDFRHDELAVVFSGALTNDSPQYPQRWRKDPAAPPVSRPQLIYARMVGGGSAHFTGNMWRFHQVDFRERSMSGGLEGASIADWPFDYSELEPYYTRAEWEMGIAGQAGVSPFDPPRSRPYPMPPHPPGSTGVLLERGAKKLGWTAFPAPMAILSRPYQGRGRCVGCGWCMGYGCEVQAKSSTLVTMIPRALATGRCEVRAGCYARKIETDARGRVTGVRYFDPERREVYQRARAVVVSANGAETPRLLLMSASNRFPQGLANSSGLVGKNLMFNGLSLALGEFADPVNAWKGPPVSRIVHDTYTLDPKLGLYGGGGYDFRGYGEPINFALSGIPPEVPRWGAAFKRTLERLYPRTVLCVGHTTTVPVATNGLALDPEVKDPWGLPALLTTHKNHPNDVKVVEYFTRKGEELLAAAGARREWSILQPAEDPGGFQMHLLGTGRMGDDPRTSVVDRFHRAHDVPNLFLVDGSSFVTGGRGQPTLTIMALAFRAGEHIARLAKAGLDRARPRGRP